MNAIRHYIFSLIVIILLWRFIGFQPALWTTVGLFLSVFIHSLAGVVARVESINRTSRWSNWTSRLIYLFTFLGIGMAALSVFLLFHYFGWITGVGFVFLWFGYYATKEQDFSREKRKVANIRSKIIKVVRENISGKLTDEQMNIRSELLFQNELPHQIFYSKTLPELFLAQEDLKVNEYQVYLKLIEKHVSKIELDPPYSDLYKMVRTKLGLPPN